MTNTKTLKKYLVIICTEDNEEEPMHIAKPYIVKAHNRLKAWAVWADHTGFKGTLYPHATLIDLEDLETLEE